MQVTNIRVSFMREKQPVQYEKAQPMVEMAGTLEDGENHLTAARNLMMDAAAVVYAGIGYEIPEKVANALLSLGADGALASDVQAKATVEVTKGPEPKDMYPDERAKAAAETKPADEKPAAKKRGRPKGSKNAPRKVTPEAAIAATSDIPGEETAPTSDIPGEETTTASDIPGEETPNISSGNEDRIDPATDAVFTPKDLHDLIIGHVKANPRTLSVQNARSILAHFKVARAQDLTNEQAVEGKVMLDQMVAEEAAS